MFQGLKKFLFGVSKRSSVVDRQEEEVCESVLTWSYEDQD